MLSNTCRFKFAGFLFLLLLQAVCAYPQTFDAIKQIKEEERVSWAVVKYKNELRKTDSAFTFAKLQQLTNIARELDDRKLECAVFACKADYYSYNSGPTILTTYNYDQAIAFARKHNLKLEEGAYTQEKAIYYFIIKQYIPAYQSFLKAQDIFNSLDSIEVPNKGMYIYQLANFYYHLGDLENTQSTLLKALHYKGSVRDSMNMYNTLGLIQRSTGKYPEALGYFAEVLEIAEQHNDTAWITIAKGNTGSIYFLKGEYDLALPYLESDYKNSLKYVDPVNAAAALLRIARIHVNRRNYSKAMAMLDTTEHLIDINYDLNKSIDIYLMRAQIYEALNQTEKSLAYRKKYESAKDSLVKQNNIAAVERVKLRWEADRHQGEMYNLQKDAHTKVVKRNSVIFILILLIIISTLLYNRQRIKRKNEKELFERQQALLESERLRAENELRNAEEALVTYTENLKQKTDLIERFNTELESMKEKLATQDYDEARIQNLEKLMNANIMTNENWDEFKKLFNKVYKDFFFQLKAKYQGLTETDIRLSALIKLKLSNREMANMMGVTPDGIKKARQRLRKKLDLPEEITLEDLMTEV